VRRTCEVTITEEGRDKGKTYLLTELPAEQAESWAFRAINALMRSGIKLPDSIVTAAASGGMQALSAISPVAIIAGFSGVNWEDVDPLLREMMTCVKIKRPDGVAYDLIPANDDIAEPLTRMKLRLEILNLHLGFSLADKFRALSASKKEKKPRTNTRMSRPSSAPSSPAGSQPS